MPNKDTVVTSKSALFWELLVRPTWFQGYFCNSVTRHFRSEPEPWSNHDYRWECAFIEHMINGVRSIDMEIRRIRVPSSQEQIASGPEIFSTLSQGSSAREGEMQSSQQQPGSSTRSASGNPGTRIEAAESWRVHGGSLQPVQPPPRHVPQSEQPPEGGDVQVLPGKIKMPRSQFKTIALLTPKWPAPIMTVSLCEATLDDAPIRFELDAATLWHRNVYHFEIVISEEFACYHVPSLSACHRVLDSLYHEIVPTFLPSQNTTDIWFEFHPPSNDGDQQGAVTAIGAHEQVLRRHPRIARWIDQERQKAQKQRHQQLEEERRIHYSQQQLHQGAGQGEMQYEEEPEEEIEEEEETLEQGRAQGYDFPSFLTQQPVMGPLNTEEPPSSTPLPGLGYLQSCPQLFLSLAEPQQRMQFAALGSTAEHLPAIPEEEEEEGVDQSSMQGILSPPTPGYPMPPLRIRVENMSPGTFQTVLQYLYTRQIGLSDEQLKDVVIYWDDDPEKHHQPCEEARCQEPSSSSAGGGGVEEAGACQTYSPIVLPPLESSSSRVGCVETTGRTLTKGVGPAAFASLQPTFTAPLFNQLDPPYGSVSSMVSSSSVYSFKATSDLTPWISCSCKSRPWLLSTPPVPSTLQPSLGSERMPPHQRMLFTSSWEDLLQAAELFDIKGLKDLAHKAVLMHCEMMTIRTCADFNVMTEVAHNGYYEAKLDLQLGLGEHVLRSFVELYNSPLLTERYERLVFRHDERGDQEQSKAQQGERDFSIVEEMMQVEGEYDEGGGGGGEDIEEQRSTRWADEHLFDNPECEKEILTLCSEIRSSFLRMRETLEGHHE